MCNGVFLCPEKLVPRRAMRSLRSREMCFAVVSMAVSGVRLFVETRRPNAKTDYGALLQGCVAPLYRAVAQRESSGFIPRATDKRQVMGSSPISPTLYAGVAQWARAPAL